MPSPATAATRRNRIGNQSFPRAIRPCPVGISPARTRPEVRTASVHLRPARPKRSPAPRALRLVTFSRQSIRVETLRARFRVLRSPTICDRETTSVRPYALLWPGTHDASCSTLRFHRVDDRESLV